MPHLSRYGAPCQPLHCSKYRDAPVLRSFDLENKLLDFGFHAFQTPDLSDECILRHAADRDRVRRERKFRRRTLYHIAHNGFSRAFELLDFCTDVRVLF